ncbi:MAG: hypothetical protein KGL98_11660 [Gammaproteobacteria bacterium]|nr:hypothetical protein [Gammaproteobacteria bacterium]MDE2461878.1 hypothetical protein [Gammaproteobacteria bacterium]
MNRYCALLAATILMSAGPWIAAAAQSTTSAPVAGTQTPALPSAKPVTMELGKVNVIAMRRMIQTLQQVKVALKRPFDDNPKHVDDMVCRLHPASFRHNQEVLECGNEGWFSSRRDITQRALAGGDWQRAANADSEVANDGPSQEYGHPWHAIRALTGTQLMYFRQVLNALPAPGQGMVTVFDKNGKAVMTIKPGEQSGSDGTH